jgi:hypothetical protein
MKVTAVKCPICQDIIFSRCQRDYHTCSCGNTSIDGGFNYIRISGSKEVIELDIGEITKEELYNDWNNMHDKYGVIK